MRYFPRPATYWAGEAFPMRKLELLRERIGKHMVAGAVAEGAQAASGEVEVEV